MIGFQNMTVPVKDKQLKKFRELSEHFWEIQQFPKGPLEEAEVLPLVVPSFEVTEESVQKLSRLTEALDSSFQSLLNEVISTFQLHGVFGDLLRVILVRVKKGKQIYKHIDKTFDDPSVSVYRMQLVSSSDKPFLEVNGKKVNPPLNVLEKLPDNAIVSEENLGLNDNIHLLLYFKQHSAQEELRLANGY